MTLTAANVDERDAAPDILQQIQGRLIGDEGYIRPELKAQLQGVSIELQTALRKNMQDTRPRAWVKLLMRVRRLIATVIGQLAGRFHLERVHARDMWHLTSRNRLPEILMFGLLLPEHSERMTQQRVALPLEDWQG